MKRPDIIALLDERKDAALTIRRIRSTSTRNLSVDEITALAYMQRHAEHRLNAASRAIAEVLGHAHA